MIRRSVLPLLCATPFLHAADVTLNAIDTLGNSSFNTAGKWDNAAAPAAGNDYFTANFVLRTPADGGSHAFAGDSLTINDTLRDDPPSSGFWYKGTGSSGVITVANLDLSGGRIVHQNGAADIFQLAGAVDVTAASQLWARQGPIQIPATVSGDDELAIVNAGYLVTLLAADNSFTGNLVNEGRFRLADGARFRFAIGAPGVSNRISGAGAVTTLDGVFLIDTSSAAASPGSTWSLVTASNAAYSATFSVSGYSVGSGSPGSRVWTSPDGGYQFSEANGTLARVTSPTLKPLTADASTLILYHCDDASGQNQITDSSASGFHGRLGTGTGTTPATLNVVPAAAMAGFGTALTLGLNDGVGVDVNGNGTWAFNAETGDLFDMSLLGTDAGASFTLEAMVRIPSLSQAGQMHIWSGDNIDGTRAFQFRINNSGVLNFDLINAGNGGALTFDLNTLAGTHAFAANQWFHVAVVYDGGNGGANAVTRFYWTRVDSGVTEANLIATSTPGQIQWDDNVDSPLAFGNDSRQFGGYGEGIQGRIDEGRVSSTARGADDFIFTEDSSDTDGDGLPDWWETANGLDPDDDGSTGESEPGAKDGPNGALGDPDNDEFTNAEEYAAGSAANNPASVPGDTDGDGLADSWELSNFGSLAQGASGDPDYDGFSNLAEQAGGSNPRDIASVPDDTDGDGMADAWETLHFGNLAALPFSDPDDDGHTNLAESLAGTDPGDAASHPAWKSPAVALMRDTVPATNAAIMPRTATYGRAINGLSFQDQILVTFNGYQYTAWYDSIGTVQKVVLARRTIDGLSVGNWEVFQTNSEFLNGDESSWDAHNTIAIGICAQDGTLHVSYDHHGHTLRYRRSVAGLCTTNTAAWGSGMLGAEQNWLQSSGITVTDVTYPQFVATPTGGLAFTWRNGSSGNGDQLMAGYNPGAGNWSAPILYIQRGGSYNGSTSRCPYINGFDFSPDGTIHVTWTWREGAGSSNHDICYASSSDGGATWKNTLGTTIATTTTGGYIRLDSPGIAFKPTDLNQLLINQQTQCVDNDGRVHAMMLHRREEPGYEYPNITTNVYSTLGTAYFHYFLEPGSQRWQQRRIPPDLFPVGSRPSIGYDAAGNLYAAFVTYNTTASVFPGYTTGRLAIASASKASQYSDWDVVQIIDVPNKFSGEPLLDQPRLVQDGILAVFLQEDSTSNNYGTSPLHVYEFAVGTAEPVLPLQSGLDRFGDDALITVFGKAGSTYRLETNTDLGTLWSPVGTTLTGQGALLAFPHADGMLGTRRFYRVRETNP